VAGGRHWRHGGSIGGTFTVPRIELVTLKTTQGKITGNFLLELSFWANTVRLQIMTFFFLRADSVASPSLSYRKLQDEAGPSLVCRRYRRWGKMFARNNEDEYYFLAGLAPLRPELLGPDADS
jgi:hypothetical protein